MKYITNKMIFMVLVPCIWILTSASSDQPESGLTKNPCFDSFNTCISQTRTTGSMKLRLALDILKSLNDDDLKSLNSKELKFVHQAKMIDSIEYQENDDPFGTNSQAQSIADKDERTEMKPIKKHGNLGTPAFSVELSSRRSLSDQVPLTFDDVIYDDGEDFMPLLGAYRVPEPGVYAFYWSVDAPEGRVQTILVKNGEAQKYGPLTQEIPSFSGTSSMSAIVECDEDDLVWVKVQSWPDEDACNTVEAKYSSFTGFKIYNSSDAPGASAFMVQLSQNATFPSFPYTIVYDTDFVNIGKDYNPTNGSFVCRENGVHVFTPSTHLTASSYCFYLRVNGQDVVPYVTCAYNTFSTSEDSGTSSASIVVECSPGDVITVAASENNLAQASSFSGYRIVDQQEIVAFSARPSETRTYSDGRRIEFDAIVTNIGGRYFPGMDSLICQDEDLYFLSWGIRIVSENDERSGEARLMMVKDGEKQVIKAGPRIGRVLSGTSTRTASTQAIVRCEEDAAFFIEAVVESGVMSFDFLLTYFTGFRLPTFT